MQIWFYFGLWVAAALVVVAFLSAGIARHLRMREVRRQQALRLLDALERYGAWMAQLRYTPVFFGESNEAAEALDEACLIRHGWFPELGTDFAELLGVHNRFMHFLTTQHALRQRDPEGWLETEHDARFMALWRQQDCIVQNIHDKLATLGSVSKVEEAIAGPSPYAQGLRA
ncbi:hypothetical protein [Ramlibacter albus]|uniref:Uncharacterized protein n=1 Tax=Ramlibacter albus TaxID=2079448 RepID=A0A923ME43_9BURK|nr:hypothetical protein [Ramlibacter albus]MBC5767891.1 hypothetical protein [Ramlibacter albus]